MYAILLSPSSVHLMRVCVLPDPCPHSKGEKGPRRKLMCETLYQVMNIHELISSSYLHHYPSFEDEETKSSEKLSKCF